MAWVRISDDFYDHPKFDAAGSLGIALWVAGLAWCNRNLSDGFIPRKAAMRLLDFEDAAEAVAHADRNGVTNAPSNTDVTPAVARFVAERLVKAGLWDEVEGGYRVHDYLDYQKSAAQITAERDKNAARQKAFRDRRREAEEGSERNVSRNSVTNAPVTSAPNPNPNPLREGSAKPPRPRATGAPDHIAVTDRMYEWAAEKGIQRDRVAAETERFLDFHRAKGSTFKDWTAAWRTWVSRAQDYAPARRPQAPTGTDPQNEWMYQ
jgi:hypothetical protein